MLDSNLNRLQVFFFSLRPISLSYDGTFQLRHRGAGDLGCHLPWLFGAGLLMVVPQVPLFTAVGRGTRGLPVPPRFLSLPGSCGFPLTILLASASGLWFCSNAYGNSHYIQLSSASPPFSAYQMISAPAWGAAVLFTFFLTIPRFASKKVPLPPPILFFCRWGGNFLVIFLFHRGSKGPWTAASALPCLD